MIIGLGTDIVEIARIQRLLNRYGKRFLERIFTDEEIYYCRQRTKAAASFAARWAAKEAFFKALGTGMRPPYAWHDIAIINNQLGKPAVLLAGVSAQQLNSASCHVSLSHSQEYATAVVIIEDSIATN